MEGEGHGPPQRPDWNGVKGLRFGDVELRFMFIVGQLPMLWKTRMKNI